MHVRLTDDSGDLSAVGGEDLLERINVVPRNVDIMHNILFDDAGIVDLLRPGRNAVVVALEENDLFAVRMCTRGHDSKAGHVVTVLGEERPIGAGHSIDQKLGEIDHDRRGCRRAVALLSLLGGSLLNVGIVVAEDVGTVRAHVVNKAVSVYVPEVAALSA